MHAPNKTPNVCQTFEQPISTQASIVEKWRLALTDEDQELKNTLFVQFSLIIGTFCTFAITVNAVVLAPPFVHKYILCFFVAES